MRDLAVAGAGGLIGLIGVIVGSRLNHRKWMREEQLRAAIEFIAASGFLFQAYRDSGPDALSQEDREKWTYEMRRARWALHLVGNSEVRRIADETHTTIVEMRYGVDDKDSSPRSPITRLADELRSELGTGPWRPRRRRKH